MSEYLRKYNSHEQQVNLQKIFDELRQNLHEEVTYSGLYTPVVGGLLGQGASSMPMPSSGTL